MSVPDFRLILRWQKIKDPKEALREIVEHESFLGYDPYYEDLRRELIEMAERCGKKE